MSRTRDPKIEFKLLEKALDYVSYDPETGNFIWKRVLNKKLKVGSRAGYKNQTGDIRIIIDRIEYKAHRIAWFVVYGEVPKIVDHINGIRDDNRITNLRSGTHRENSSNHKCHREGRALPVGVTKDRKAIVRPYQARVYHGGKNHSIGRFNTPEEADQARKTYLKENNL